MEIDLQYFIQQIKKRENLRFDSHVAEYMGVDPKNLAMNKMRKVIPIKYIQWYCDKYNVERTKFERHIRGSGVAKKESEEGELTMNQQNMLIRYQQKEIEELKQQLKPNKFQTMDVDINYQFIIYAKYELQGIGMPKVAYQSNTYDKDYPCMQNWKYLSEKFDYTEEQIINAWSLDNFYKYDDHPIHMLRNEKHKVGVIKQAVSMLTSMLSNNNTLEFLTFKLPIIYQSKNGKPLHCMNKYEVDTVKKIVLCKLHFMNGTD